MNIRPLYSKLESHCIRGFFARVAMRIYRESQQLCLHRVWTLHGYSRSTATVTERSSGTRYSRKNSGGTPPSKPYPLSQQLPDRGSKASKCRPTKQIPPPTSATRRQRKRSFQMSSVLHSKKNSLSQSPKKEGPAMITIKFNGKPTQIPTSTTITTFLTTHNYNPIHVVVELNEVIIPKDSYLTTTLSPDDTLEILTFMGGGQ